MPSPFPGMDPYLEGELWTGFHTLLAAEIVRSLNRTLGPNYVALAQQRFVMIVPGEITVAPADIYPDVGVTRKTRSRRRTDRAAVVAAPLEIDLLRKGKRVPMRQPLPLADYFVLLSRAKQRPLTEVWPITLDETLPAVPVPLSGKDLPAALELQRVFTTVYDEGRYRSLIDYSRPPDVPLPNERLAWLKRRLKSKDK